MPTSSDARPELPAPKRCGSYRNGHTVHHIQARLSARLAPDEPRTIAIIDDDGTITFTDGTSVWNHHPERLRVAVASYGSKVRLGAYGVLRVPSAT